MIMKKFNDADLQKGVIYNIVYYVKGKRYEITGEYDFSLNDNVFFKKDNYSSDFYRLKKHWIHSAI